MTEPQTLQDVYDEQFNGKQPVGYDEAYNKWKAKPTQERLRGVLTTLTPVITQAVGQYAGQHAPQTLHSRAKLLAAKAVQTWQSDGGANLKTHVFRQLQALQRMAPSVSDPFSPSERFRQHQQQLFNATTVAQSTLGRDPSDEELATATGLPLRRVVKVRTRMRARLPASTFEEAEDDQTKPDIIGSTRSPQDDWAEAVYHDLGDRDRLIFMHRTGYRGTPVLNNMELAKQLGVSPGLVSQRAGRIQARLDAYHGR